MLDSSLKNRWLVSVQARLGLLLACAVSVASLALATVVHAEGEDGVPSADASTEVVAGDMIAPESDPTGTPAPAWSSDEGGTDTQSDTSDFVELTPTVPQGPLSQDNPFTTGTTDGSQGAGSDSTTTQDLPYTSWSDGSQGSGSDSSTTQDSPDSSHSDGSQDSGSDSTSTQDSPDSSSSDGSQGSGSDSSTTQDSPDSSSSDGSQGSGSDSSTTQDSPDSSSSDGSQDSGSDSTTAYDSPDGSSSDPQSPTSDEPTVGSPAGTEQEPTTGPTITEQAEVTATYTAASTATATATATANDTTSPAETGTAIPNYTALTESTATATSTYTAVPGTTGTAAATATVTLAPVETATAIPSATTPSQNTATATYTDTAVPTGTGIATATTSHTATATATASYTGTATPTDTPAPTLTPTVTSRSTDTATATPTPTDTETPEPETHCGTTSPDTYRATYLSADGEEGGAVVSFNLSISNNGEQLSAQLMIGGVPVNAEITQGSCQGCYTVTSADPDLSLDIAGYTVSSFVMDDGIGGATELIPADGTPASVNECAPPTGTAVATDTAADTATPTATVTPTATETATDTATETATATATATYTATYTETATVTPTETATLTATATATDTATETATDTATVTPTETSTATPSVTPTSELSDEPDVCMSEDAFSQKLDDFMANQGVPDKFECDAEGSSMFAPQAGDSEMRTWTQSGARTFPEERKSRALVDPDLCGGEGGAAQAQAPSQPFPAIAAKLAAVNAVKSEKGGTKCCFYQYSDEKSRGGGSAADGHKRSAFLYDWEWEVKDGKRDPNCDYVFDCPMLNDAPYPNPTTQRSCHLTRMWEDSREKGEGNYVRLATWGVLKGDNDPRLDAQDFIYKNASGRPFANEQEALRDFAARTGRTAESLPAVAPYYIGKDNKVIYLKKMKIPENASTEPIRASKTRSPIGQAVKKFGCTSQKHVQLTHANPSFGYQMCQSIFRDCKVEGAVEPDGSRRSYQAQVHGCSQIGFGKGMCEAVNDLVSDFKKRCEADPKKRESIVLIGNQVDNWHPDAEGSASCRWRNSEGYARGDNVGTIRKFKANKNGFIVCMRGGDGWIPDPHFCRPYGLKNEQTNNSKRAPELTCASSNTGK